MTDQQLNSITFYMGGSWVYDSLHDMPESNKQRLLGEFIDTHGQEVLDETIAYQANDYQDPMPKWLQQRCK